MTSATDNRTTERLMAMLEERGVKHELEHDLYVEWVDARGNDVTAFETSCKHKGDVLIVHVFLTPEQAIAATLNARAERTCRIVEYDDAPIPVCSECGAVQPDDFTVYYCWSCGCKAVSA